MAKKMVAVFLLCIVVVAALQFSTVDAVGEEIKYRSCYQTCEKECLDHGNGYTYCEIKCDEDCGDKEIADKLHIKPAI